ncbi:MAG: hypothetical protein M1835_001913 [Candelina submexicana]|nr:MAG: hypothetical protein M1835_001913 [Candelina submexicana]
MSFVPLNPRPMLQGLYDPLLLFFPIRPSARPLFSLEAPSIPDFILTLPNLTIFLIRINEDILVRLKWGETEYKGRLVSVDSYMNIQLTNTEEFIDGKGTGTLGQVLIR